MESGDKREEDIFVSEDYEHFLGKVDAISSILKGMRSEDPDVAQFSMTRAEAYLKEMKPDDDREINEEMLRVKSNKTLINKAEPKEDQENMSMRAFMATMEVDAKKRAEERRMRKEAADRLKREGNAAFRKGDYQKALLSYTRALEEVRDSALMYNNRALTCLKLGLYKRALEDVELALRLNKSSVKARAYKACALHRRGEREESERVLEEAIALCPEQEEFLREFKESWLREEEMGEKEEVYNAEGLEAQKFPTAEGLDSVNAEACESVAADEMKPEVSKEELQLAFKVNSEEFQPSNKEAGASSDGSCDEERNDGWKLVADDGFSIESNDSISDCDSSDIFA